MLSILILTTATLVAQARTPAPKAGPDTATLAIQVALDRAGFSSGAIDGRMGANTRRALDAYRATHGREPEPSADPLVPYRITAEDADGPFVAEIPQDLMAQSQLPALGYRSAQEALAERFHTTPEVLTALNEAATFAAGETIRVPNVEPMDAPASLPKNATEPAQQKPTGTSGRRGAAPAPDAAEGVMVRISRSSGALSVTGQDGRTVLFAPVTTGSTHDPLPLGEWKVNSVHYNPPFRYNPDLFWDADPAHTKATIPPGPNGPVGLVWIDISKEHYGLHGTPEPAQIGRTQSHGCVRLTNWDAIRLAKLVRPGTRVIFTE
jgi:lipoprotein-anchoring transpeptidase ErfK/SrfK